VILFINDPHVADRPPLGRVVGYADQIMAKLEECRSLVGPNDVTVITGDLFHTKRPSFVSHALVQRILDLFDGWPGRIFTVLGNHDLSEAGVASLPKQPIGVLLQAGAIELLSEAGVIVKVQGKRAYLEAAHYSDTTDPKHFGLRDPAGIADGVEVMIKVAHGPILPPGLDPPFDHINADKIPPTADFCFYGHIHDDHGTYKVDLCTYVNFGAVGRVARTESNRTRTVAVAMYDVETGTVTRHELQSVLPADDVFITVEGEEAAEDGDLKAYARELVHALQRGSSTSIDDLLAEVSEGIDKDVKAGVVRYLNEAGL